MITFQLIRRSAPTLKLSGGNEGIKTRDWAARRYQRHTHFFRSWAVRLPSGRPLAFSVSSRSGECFGRINMRGFLSSPLVVVGKGLKLTRNRSVGHGLGSAKQSLVLSLDIPCLVVRSVNVMKPSRGSPALVEGDLEPGQPIPITCPASSEAIDALLGTKGGSPRVVPDETKLAITNRASRGSARSQTFGAVQHCSLLLVLSSLFVDHPSFTRRTS